MGFHQRKQTHQRLSVLKKEADSRKKTFVGSANTATMLPFFAAGYGFADDMFDNMICHSYYSPGVVRFTYELLLSEEGHTSHAQTPTLHHPIGDSAPPLAPSRITSSITQMALPDAFVGLSFGELFAFWIEQEDIVPVGLYRRTARHDALPYVVTGPPCDTVLQHDDLVFVLAQPRQKQQPQQSVQPKADADAVVEVAHVRVNLPGVETSTNSPPCTPDTPVVEATGSTVQNTTQSE